MNDIDIFRAAASQSLPEAVFQQLLPHLDSLVSSYKEKQIDEEEMEDWKARCDQEDYRDIREEYEDATEINWQAFARERWPEIDKYFKFKAIDPLTKKVVHPTPKPPTPAPWARSLPSNGVKAPWNKG